MHEKLETLALALAILAVAALTVTWVTALLRRQSTVLRAPERPVEFTPSALARLPGERAR
jgi:hypothetical protein